VVGGQGFHFLVLAVPRALKIKVSLFKEHVCGLAMEDDRNSDPPSGFKGAQRGYESHNLNTGYESQEAPYILPDLTIFVLEDDILNPTFRSVAFQTGVTEGLEPQESAC
jgi:hypothetical protein